MVAAVRNKINVYICPNCGRKIVTIDITEGVTPFTMMCDRCGGSAESCFYRCPQDIKPEYAWYKPTDDSDYDAQFEFEMNRFGGQKVRPMIDKNQVIQANKEHVAKGGLLLKLYVQPQPTPEPEKQTCPRRMDDFGPWEKKENLDHWRVEKNGDRTCSFCGSLHPVDFEALIDLCLRDVSNCQIEPSTKTYKIYINRPNVKNAGDGGIKFYNYHCRGLSADHCQSVQLKLNEAIKKSNEWRKQ